MEWLLDEFKSSRKKVALLCFISLYMPSLMFYYYIVQVKSGGLTGLMVAMCLMHIYVSVMHSFPRALTKYTNLFMIVLGEDTMQGKGFENNKQRILFILTQGIAAASIVAKMPEMVYQIVASVIGMSPTLRFKQVFRRTSVHHPRSVQTISMM